MEKRHIVISDIHGHDDKFVELLNKVNFDQNKDQLVLLGDYGDRGPQSDAVIDRVRLFVKNGAIALRGNHDQMLINAFGNDDVPTGPYSFGHRGNKDSIDCALNNGADKTLKSYGVRNFSFSAAKSNSRLQTDLLFLASLPNKIQIENYRFVHAGVRTKIAWDNQCQDDLHWIRGEWYCSHYLRLPGDNEDFTYVSGHTRASYIMQERKTYAPKDLQCELRDWTVFEPNRIFIDGGMCYKGALVALILPERETVYVV